jgi:hypothetical protein
VAVEQAQQDARDEAHLPPRPRISRLKELGDYRIVREIGRGGYGGGL